MSAIGQLRIDAADWETGKVQLNAILGQLQTGAMILRGVKIDMSSTVAPATAPGPGDPNIRGATIAGVATFYHYNGAAWTTF